MALDESERRKHLQEQLRKWDEVHAHFTLILITMHDPHKVALSNDEGSRLIRELSDTYHYYLDPDSIPSFTDRNKRVSCPGR